MRPIAQVGHRWEIQDPRQEGAQIAGLHLLNNAFPGCDFGAGFPLLIDGRFVLTSA